MIIIWIVCSFDCKEYLMMNVSVARLVILIVFSQVLQKTLSFQEERQSFKDIIQVAYVPYCLMWNICESIVFSLCLAYIMRIASLLIE